MGTPSPETATHAFRVDAAYTQFYIGDSATRAPAGDDDFWSLEAMDRRLAVTPDFLGVATEVNDWVPVVVEVRAGPPGDDLGDWDHVAEASLAAPTGRVAIDGCTYFSPENAPRWRPGLPRDPYRSPHITVLPGIYRVCVCYGNIDPDNDLRDDHDEHYRIVLWPAPFAEPAVLRLKPRQP